METSHMPEIVLANQNADGLEALVAGLLEQALEEPAKAATIGGMRGTVLLSLTDAGSDVGLEFRGERVVISPSTKAPDLHLSLPSESLLSLANLPRWGVIPKFTDASGRHLYRQLGAREVRVRGLRHLRLLRQLMTVLTI